MVRAFTPDAEGLLIQDSLTAGTQFLTNSSVHTVGNGYPAFFRAGEGEGIEKEKWYPISVALLLVQVSSLTVTYPPIGIS